LEFDHARALALELLVHEEPFNDITLKQFRDVEDPQAACFQAIVQAPITIEQIFEISEIEEPLQLSLHRYTSHPIAEILGLKPKAQKRGDGGTIDIFEPIRPFWVTAALKKGLGKNLCWRAGINWQREPEGPNQSRYFQEEGDTKMGQALVQMIDDQYAGAALESSPQPQSLIACCACLRPSCRVDLMLAYPKEVRIRVVNAVEQGEGTIAEISTLFGVGLTFVKKMLRLHRAGEDLAPPHGGGPVARLHEPELALLRHEVAQQPDVTLEELQRALGEQRQVSVSRATICRALQRLGLPRKKSLVASERDEKARKKFRKLTCAFEVGHYIFLDEMGSNLRLTRQYGRAAPGTRVPDQVPGNRGGQHLHDWRNRARWHSHGLEGAWRD